MELKIAAVDFDGTIVEDRYPEIGKVNERTVRYIRYLKRNGYKLILWTCRSGDLLEKAIEELKKYNFIPNFINQGNGKRFEKSPKINADIYIDDRSCLSSEIDWQKYYSKFKEIKQKNFKLKKLGY